MKLHLSNNPTKSVIFLVCIAAGTMSVVFNASANNCDIWGDFAATAFADYQAQIEGGVEDPIGQVRELLGFEYTDPGSMGHDYYGKILNAIESGIDRDGLYKVGKEVCLSYPKNTFYPDPIE